MRVKKVLRFVLIVNCGEDLVSATMALICALSVKRAHDLSELFLVVDTETKLKLVRDCQLLVDQCDKIVSVDVPGGTPVYMNRWIKTQLPRFVKGPAMYLDNDILVRGNLERFFQTHCDFCAVANHNAWNVQAQIWEEDRKFIAEMDWGTGETYFNGGVWYYSDGDPVIEFFELWHRLWLEGVQRLGRLRDQPSLNFALKSADVRVAEAPRDYNWQLKTNVESPASAKVWHFYSTDDGVNNTCFEHLVRLGGMADLGELKRCVDYCSSLPTEKIKNWDIVTRVIAIFFGVAFSRRSEILFWLLGRRKEAVLNLLRKK